MVVADILGVDPSAVTSGPATTPTGTPTPASRAPTRASSPSRASSAVKGATDRLAADIRTLAAGILGADGPEDIVLEGGFAKLRDNPEAALPFMALGAIVNANNAILSEEGRELTLNSRFVYVPPFELPDVERKYGNLTLTYATQVHTAILEVDPETGSYEIVDYAAVDDCGIRIHPQIVEGQVMGAAAHGIGAATHETFTYDEEGNLLTPNFYDYHVPHAMDVPPLKTGRDRVALAVHAARDEGHGRGRRRQRSTPICSALQDALRSAGAPIVYDSCNPPHRVWELLRDPAASRERVQVVPA